MNTLDHVPKAQLGCCRKCGKLNQRLKLTKVWDIEHEGIIHAITTKHRLYKLRYGMLSRCYNAKDKEYASYQGKGIKVCDEWKQEPVAFYKWAIANGWKQDGYLSIDRIDSNNDYMPSNCQFITRSENSKKNHIHHLYSGSKAPRSKLKEQDVDTIRKYLSEGLSQRKIAKMFNVAPNTIGAIQNGINWKYYKGDLI